MNLNEGGSLPMNHVMKESMVGYSGLHIERYADVHVAAVLRSHGYYVMAMADGAACDTVATGRGMCDFRDYTMFCQPPVSMASALVGTVAMPRTLLLLAAFAPTLLEGVPHESDASNYTFFGYSPRESLHMSVAEYGIMNGCAEDIVCELKHEDDSYKGAILARHVIRILDYAQRFYDRQFAMREEECKAAVGLYMDSMDDYIASGRMAYDGIPSSRECAAAAGMSEAYFSDMLLFVTGRTHESLLTERRIEAARRMLSSHCVSVRSVAERLAFGSEAYFRYVYMKMTGLSPEQSAADA